MKKNHPKRNEHELATILQLLSIGMTKKYIRKKLKISKSNLSNYLSKLELFGNIKREGKYKVDVLSSSLIHPKVTINSINKKLNKRGHAHNFKILFPQETKDLRLKNSVKQELKSNKRFKTLKFGSIRFSYKRFTIWINNSTLTIYSRNSYYSEDALHTKFMALKDLDILINYLKNKLNFKGIYGIEIFREHYGLIFNKFAEWLLSKGRKMNIKDKGNKSILWVDDSKEDDIGLKEFEGINPIEVNNADKLFESHERTNWKVTPEFVLNTISGVTQNQLMFAKNMESHIAAIKSLSKGVRGLGGAIRKVKKENTKLKLESKHQTTLDNY